MVIEVNWRTLEEHDLGWNYSKCLYAYQMPNAKKILYIGKAWGTSVRNRWSWSGKPEFWEYLKRTGITHHKVLIGDTYLPKGCRLTIELLADIESLLINIEKPPGNILSRETRIRRPGMQVRCVGEWPGTRKTYNDE